MAGSATTDDFCALWRIQCEQNLPSAVTLLQVAVASLWNYYYFWARNRFLSDIAGVSVASSFRKSIELKYDFGGRLEVGLVTTSLRFTISLIEPQFQPNASKKRFRKII